MTQIVLIFGYMMLTSSPPHLTSWTLEDEASFKMMMSMSVKQSNVL